MTTSLFYAIQVVAIYSPYAYLEDLTMGSNDKADGLARVASIEKTTQKRGNSGAGFSKNKGPAAGGSLSGNPTSSGKIKR